MDSDTLRAILLAFALLAFALYLGGAISMELILRFAQEDLPGPQTAVTCKVSGDRWKWIALFTILATGASTLPMVLMRSPVIPSAYGWVYVTAIVGCAAAWAALLTILVKMSFRAHPALAFRPDPSMSPEEFAETRQALKRAIRRMDLLLRAELGIAIFMGACLSVISGLAVQ